jgi:hypothetical protein
MKLLDSKEVVRRLIGAGLPRANAARRLKEWLAAQGWKVTSFDFVPEKEVDGYLMRLVVPWPPMKDSPRWPHTDLILRDSRSEVKRKIAKFVKEMFPGQATHVSVGGDHKNLSANIHVWH